MALSLAEQKLADVRLDGPSLYLDDEGLFDAPHEGFGWHVTAHEDGDFPGLYAWSA